MRKCVIVAYWVLCLGLVVAIFARQERIYRSLQTQGNVRPEPASRPPGSDHLNPTGPVYSELEPESITNLGIYRVSAYCPCKACCNKNPNHPLFRITKSEYKIQFGDKLVAAPPSFPFKTILNVPGYGKVPVLDRGGVIKGKRLDVLFYERSPDHRTDLEYSHQLALNWGIQYADIRIFE